MKVLVPVDQSNVSKAILDLALRLARAVQAETHLITVTPEHGGVQTAEAGDGHLKVPTGNGTVQPARAAAQEFIDGLAAGFAGVNIKTTVLVQEAPAPAIVAYAAGQAGDLIVMPTHGRRGLGRTLLGSVAEGVTRGSHVPVLLAGPRYRSEQPAAFQNLVVCVDGSPFSEAILPVAITWASSLHMQVVVVEALSPSDEAQVAEQDLREDIYIRRLAQDLQHQGLNAGWEVLHDANAADAITRYADLLPGAVVAMTTHGRTGLARLVMGSVAMRVVQTCRWPVLVMRPAGVS